MPDLLELITSSLGGSNIKQLGQSIGADPSATERAVKGAVPTLLSALARNAASEQGATELHSALQQDHSGSVLDDVGGFLSRGDADQNFRGSGDGILKHLLGSKRGAVETGLSAASGLNAESTGKLLSTLAPMVMGALGRQSSQQGLDASGLASLLGQQRSQQEAEPAMGFIGKLLDQDDDGSIIDDIAGKLFGR